MFFAVLVDEDSDLFEISDGHFQRAKIDCRVLQQILVVVILLVIGHHDFHQAQVERFAFFLPEIIT